MCRILTNIVIYHWFVVVLQQLLAYLGMICTQRDPENGIIRWYYLGQ